MHNILIIDDEQDVRDAMRRVLERIGFHVRTAVDGDDGLAQLRRGECDVAITDIIMPKSNGVEVIANMRREFPTLRIIAISGGGNFGIADYQPNAITTTAYLAAASKAGADLVLTKPFEIDDLVTAIAKALGTGRA